MEGKVRSSVQKQEIKINLYNLNCLKKKKKNYTSEILKKESKELRYKAS